MKPLGVAFFVPIVSTQPLLTEDHVTIILFLALKYLLASENMHSGSSSTVPEKLIDIKSIDRFIL